MSDQLILEELLGTIEYGSLAVIFIVSFISNSIPYMTVPYLIGIASYSALVDDPVVKLLVIVVGGLGAGLGKVVVFLIGRGFHRFIPENSRKSLSILLRRLRRSMFLIVFLVAALPLPDDIVYVPLGLAGYSITLYTIAVILGKMVITGLAVILGSGLTALMGGASIEASIIAAAVGIVASILVAKMDWTKILEAYDKEGLIQAIIAMITEALCALLNLFTLGRLCKEDKSESSLASRVQ